MRKLDVVNFLRGYSISTIVIMHLVGMLGISGIWEKAAAFGGAGVHVFILCSGFGLYLSYLRKPLGYIAFPEETFYENLYADGRLVRGHGCLDGLYGA
ncbi:hypothetical protein [Paraprevotella clara]|uniref:hypothetical protein n=1 Tax=Paraprevotella clara TaxID=454154 RepID=UPI003AB37ABC